MGRLPGMLASKRVASCEGAEMELCFVFGKHGLSLIDGSLQAQGSHVHRTKPPDRSEKVKCAHFPGQCRVGTRSPPPP